MSELTVIAVIDTNYIIRFFKNPDKPKQKEFFLKELKKLILSGQVLLIKPVKDELMNFNFEDEIIKQVKEIDSDSIIDPKYNEEILLNFGLIMDHLNKSPYYTKTSVEIWENKTADPMVIATAMTYGCAVFTLESGKQSRDINYPSSREPKVLNICDDLGVEILNLDSFLSLTDLAKFY